MTYFAYLKQGRKLRPCSKYKGHDSDIFRMVLVSKIECLRL